MTSKHLETITDHLSNLHGHAYFRPQAGPLRQRLKEAVLDAAEAEVAEELSEGTFDLEISIGRPEDEGELQVSFSVDHPGVSHTSQIALTALSDEELQDLAGYLARLEQNAAPAETTADGKTVLRKKVEGDNHEKEAAAARLKVSPEWLKSVVPCTDYSYDEIDGKKYIREYYWSKELIERLFKMKSTKTTPEDLQFVAKECCEGDLDWARDLIGRLKSPNRPEPAVREQAQKSQNRPAQNQARPAQGQGRQGQSQGRVAQGQGRPGQNQGRSGSQNQEGRSASQNQEKPAQSQGNPAQNQGNAAQGQGNPAQGQGRPAAAKVVPGERTRQRSRHKKPFRGEPGKDAALKPESAAAQKQPQN